MDLERHPKAPATEPLTAHTIPEEGEERERAGETEQKKEAESDETTKDAASKTQKKVS